MIEPPRCLFPATASLEALNALSRDTAIDTLGIVFTELGPDYLRATMPVDARTRQPYGLLHGGASVLLAETLGSTAGNLCAAAGRRCVGVEINANHIRAVSRGVITVTATPIFPGRTMSIWQIDITNDKGKLVCTGRCSVLLQKRPAFPQEN